MTDEERIRLATRSVDGHSMLGPIERERCLKHKTRWVQYRWTWDAGPDGHISSGDVYVVKSCGACLAEEQKALDEDLLDD